MVRYNQLRTQLRSLRNYILSDIQCKQNPLNCMVRMANQQADIVKIQFIAAGRLFIQICQNLSDCYQRSVSSFILYKAGKCARRRSACGCTPAVTGLHTSQCTLHTLYLRSQIHW